MANKFHQNLIDTDIHASTAVTYADITARDADTAFNTATSSINKIVRTDSPVAYFILISTVPTWFELSPAAVSSSYLGLTDTPSSYVGEAGNIVQVNTGETALEFGQDLLTTSTPTFGGIVGTINLDLSATAGNVIIDNSMIVVGDTQPYLFEGQGDVLTIQGQSLATGSFLEIFSKDGDGTDSVGFNIYADGTPGSIVNSEVMAIAYRAADTQFEISSGASGSGTIRDISIFTEGNTDQLLLESNGDIRVGGDVIPLVSSTFALGSPSRRFTDVFLDSTISYTNGLFFESPDGIFLEFNTNPNDANIDLRAPTLTGRALVNFEDNGGVIRAAVTFSDATDQFDINSDNTIGMNCQNAGSVGIRQQGGADTNHILSLINSGTNGATINFHVGDRDPTGSVTANPGDVYFDADTTDSAIYLHRGTITDNTSWEEVLTAAVGTNPVTTQDTLTDNFLVRGNGAEEIDIASSDDVAGIMSNAGASILSIRPVVAGAVNFILEDSGGINSVILNYNDLTDTSALSSTTALDILGLSGDMRFVTSTGDIDIISAGDLAMAVTGATTLNGNSIVQTTDVLTANTLIVGNGTDQVKVQDQMTVNGGGDELRIDAVTSGVGSFIIRDDVGTSKISMSYNDASDIANLAFSDGGNPVIQWLGATQRLEMTHKNAVDDQAVFQKWDRQGGTDPASINWFLTPNDAVGQTFPGQGFGDHAISKSATTAIGLYVLRGGIWYPYITTETGVETADVMDANAIVTGAGTSNIQVTDSIFASISGDNSIMQIDSRSVTGEATFELRDSLGSAVFDLTFLETSGLNQLTLTNPLLVDSTGVTSFFRTGGDDGDGILILGQTGTNPGTIEVFGTDRDPVGNVTADGGDIMLREDGVQSSIYLHKGSTSNNTDWFQVSVNSETVVEVFNESDLDINITGVASTTSGVTTVTGVLRLDIKGGFTTAHEFVLSGSADLQITRPGTVAHALTTTTTGTFISGTGNLRIIDGVIIINTGSGTFLDLTGGIYIHQFGVLIGWADLGTFTGSATSLWLSRFMTFVSCTIGYNIVNSAGAQFSNNSFSGTAFTGAFLEYTTNLENSTLDIDNVNGTLGSTQSILNIDPRVPDSTQIGFINSGISGGNLFTIGTAIDSTINAVTDSSPVTATITAMADNGAGGTTISVVSLAVEDEIVTISGTTAYNGTFRVFNATASIEFDIPVAFVTDEATGSVDMERLDLESLVGHSIVAGDSIKVVDTNFYNGFYNVLGILGGDIIVNGTFIADDGGTIQPDRGLDQTDSRVTAINNIDFLDSKTIASQHIEKNAIATTISAANTYQDVDLTGSTGAITVAASGGAGLTTLTSTAHGLLENQNVKVRNTSLYNGMFRIRNVTTNTFDVPVTFGLTQTGTWDAKLLLGSSAERFIMTDQDNGEMKYIGSEPFSGSVTYTMAAFKSGSTENYQWALAVNGEIPEGSPFAERDITTALGTATLVAPLSLVEGDLIKPQVAATGTTNSITHQAFSMNAQ